MNMRAREKRESEFDLRGDEPCERTYQERLRDRSSY
jgi:hypothetical protein